MINNSNNNQVRKKRSENKNNNRIKLIIINIMRMCHFKINAIAMVFFCFVRLT